MKFSKAKPSDDGSPRIEIAVPASDGTQLPKLLSKENMASDVWADSLPVEGE